MVIQHKKGDIVNTAFGVAVILDVMHSSEQDAATIYVQFARSIGRTHPNGDGIKVTPDNMHGVDTWRPATREELQAAIEGRRQELERELQATLDLAKERIPA